MTQVYLKTKTKLIFKLKQVWSVLCNLKIVRIDLIIIFCGLVEYQHPLVLQA